MRNSSSIYKAIITYDAGNRRASQSCADGKVKTWEYDGRNIVERVLYDGDEVFTQTHDAGCRLETQDFANGLTRTLTYRRSDNYRTRDQVSTHASLDLSYDYAVDKQITEEITAGSLLAETSFKVSNPICSNLINWK